ncbi:MAG: hypothetical protein MUO40_03740 [Anaerolineaceae bacterium]|nr:hypothetical protein [Anaerolineaceae bacterium]
MKTYRLDQAKFTQTKKSIILLYGITGVLMIIVAVWMNWERIVEKDLFSIIVVPLLLGLLVYSALRAIKQRKEYWDDYKLEIDENGLTQTQPRFPDLHISNDEITNLREGKFGLIISSEKYRDLLGVTKNLGDENYQEVKTILESWLSVSKDNETLDEVTD